MKQAQRAQFVLFALIGAGFLLNGLVVLAASPTWHDLAAQVAATVLALAWGFMAHHVWTFSMGRT